MRPWPWCNYCILLHMCMCLIDASTYASINLAFYPTYIWSWTKHVAWCLLLNWGKDWIGKRSLLIGIYTILYIYHMVYIYIYTSTYVVSDIIWCFPRLKLLKSILTLLDWQECVRLNTHPSFLLWLRIAHLQTFGWSTASKRPVCVAQFPMCLLLKPNSTWLMEPFWLPRCPFRPWLLMSYPILFPWCNQ